MKILAGLLLAVSIRVLASDVTTGEGEVLYPRPVSSALKSARFVEATKILAITAAKHSSVKENFFPKGITREELYADAAISNESESLSITWLGHATTLIQMHGLNVLTDPVFGDLSAIHPRMVRPVNFESMPRIDVILISHNHLDHFDVHSLGLLVKRWPNVQLYVPRGDRTLAETTGAAHVREFSWGQTSKVGQLSFAFLPSKHWSGRGVSDGYASAWGSWMVTGPLATVYFGGDSGFDSDMFMTIGRFYRQIDVALLPVGPVNPRPLMQATHMSPDEVIRAFSLLGAKRLIPIHWGTYPLGPDTYLDAIGPMREWANREASALQTDGRCFQELKFGGRFSLDGACGNL